ncbi:GGDEF domain-containing protein [Tepidamorphus sp. 3E244]|uniref:GGDEF domain-containing protein n=1 Tax=Tepidamorphus sp. 3E244 TaxID=3385498 RepID=UPI0038FC645D
MSGYEEDREAEIRRLKLQLSAAQQKIDLLEARANEDALLGILNRRGLEENLRRAIAFSDRYKMVAAMIYADVDNFKAINDTYGHDAGDLALRHLVSVLHANTRGSDMVGRVGGDEFVILLWNATTEIAESKARALSAMLARRPIIIDGQRVHVGISCGVSELHGKDTAQQALARADRAMYQSKKSRKKALTNA